MEEQTATTQDISLDVQVSGSVGRVSRVIQDISHNMGQSTSFSSQIAEGMSEFNTITTSMSDHCVKMSQGAENLASLAQALSDRVGKFKV